MNAPFIQQLEERRLLSGLSELLDVQPAAGPPAPVYDVVAALGIKYPKLIGTWKGYATMEGERAPLTLKVTAQNKANFTARITSKVEKSLKINLTGHFTSRTTVKLTFSGRDGTDRFGGKGSGTLSEKATKLSGRYTQTYGSETGATARFVFNR